MILNHSRDINNIYFIAICGTAMASLAAMLKSQGYHVTGSDEAVYPPMSTFLESQGIQIFHGFDAAHLDPPPDLVVIGNAMSRGNPEVEAVLNNKIPYTSLPELLKHFFIQGKKSIVATGTHGKTTTASLIAWLLEHSGLKPGFLIGGIPENFGQGFKVGGAQYFVVEGDEYDTAFFDKGPKFLHYLPDVVVINNIEFDHADIYQNLDQIKLNFKRMVNLIPGNGYLLANADDPNVADVIENAFCTVETFGTGIGATWRAEAISMLQEVTAFELLYKNQRLATVRIPLCGEHNVRNAMAAIAVCRWFGIDFTLISNGLSTFKGVRRRLQLQSEIKGIKIFDDFAHHPTEIKSTLKGLRLRYPDNRLWAVFEPRSSTAKRNIFIDQYVDAFSVPDVSILGPIHRPDKVDQLELLNINKLISLLNEKLKVCYYFDSNEKIVDHLKKQTKPGDIIVIMSNGSFGNLQHKLTEALE
ncbi:UDP-N-acetylmuramate:L-alanyl-gamma-D-glutamyl-meso-diaminopimelate ligase [candidate division KSB1 bacterium]|nr:UDP-N-acetylmuramate:L-alanyl-gamma-D-glutamyl-meso-diaminopimelate ligase [candidate division KSB1 bacterium]